MENAQVFINHNGKVHGPYSVPAVVGALRVRRFPAKAPARLAGEEQWRPLDAIISDLQSAQAIIRPLTSQPAEVKEWGRHPDSVDLAAARRRVLVRSALVGCALLVVGIFWLGNTTLSSVSTGETEPSSAPDELPATPPSSGEVSLARNQQEAARCAVMIRGSNSAGSGSLVMESGKVYLYTNIHVVCETKFTVIDYRGDPIRVDETGEIPNNSLADLVRFVVLEQPDLALAMAGRDEIEQGGTVVALGDSEGAGVIASLPGSVTGIGPDRIEVDCPFVPGNSGGPIVNEDGKLLALASYLTSNQSIWAKGTRQEVRRFGWIPSARYQWVKMDRADLVQESQLIKNTAMTSRLIKAIEIFTMDIDGFKFPASWPEEDRYELQQVLEESRDHPLFKGLLKTNQTLAKFSGSSSRSESATAKREYRRFLEFCAKYSRDQLTEMEQEIESAYWSSLVSQRIASQKKIQNSFEQLVGDFSSSGRLGSSLSD